MSHQRSLKKRLALGLATLISGVGIAPAAFAAWDLNMPVGVSELSPQIYDLHMLILWVCVAIAVVVFGAMIYSIIAFRKSKGAVPATFTHSTTAEIVWTVIPIVILIAMAVPSAKMLVKTEDTRASDITVKVTGFQWKWHYEYLDEGFGFYSNLDQASNAARRLNSGIDPNTVDNYLRDVDNPMVVPVGAKIRMLITANDVIHAWWIPDFAAKKDAIPGFINEFWFRAEKEGTYRGQCAELCGRDHGFMPVVVVVKPQGEYNAWVDEQRQLAGLPPKVDADAAVAAAKR